MATDQLRKNFGVRIKELEAFASEDQETVIKLIDAMIVKNKIEGAIKSFEKKVG